MRNQILSLVTAGVLAMGATVAPMAQANEGFNDNHWRGEFVDQDTIGNWAEPYVNVLVELGVLVGYPDGSFRPAENITREEFSVALVKAISILEQQLLGYVASEDAQLYNEIANLQVLLIEALARIDVIEAEQLVTNNNWVGIQVNYTADRGVNTSDTSVELNAKIQLVELSDTFAISVRPFLNSNTEAGASVTLDVDVTEKLEVAAGLGGAIRADDSVLGSITGTSEDVVPYANFNVSYKVNDRMGVYTDAKVPFNGNDGKELTIGAGVFLQF